MSDPSPAIPDSVIGNIDAVLALERRSEQRRSLPARLAHAVGDTVGSVPFAVVHLIGFAAWIALNSGLWRATLFDPYPFSLLGTLVSCEAVALTTFVLIRQNRQEELAEKRSHLDLQVNLLAEREVTKILQLLERLSARIGVQVDDEELNELMQDVGVETLASGLRAKWPQPGRASEGQA